MKEIFWTDRHRREYSMSDYFYGWYFRCQGRDGSIAVIPAVHLSAEKRTCSIQVITQKGSLYREFPVSRFRVNREKGIMRIGENLFSRKGIRLRIEMKGNDAAVISGTLRFGEFAEPGYDIMGPFRYIPGMECRHAVYSMLHSRDICVDTAFPEERIAYACRGVNSSDET